MKKIIFCIICNYKKMCKSDFCNKCIRYMLNNKIVKNTELSCILEKDIYFNHLYQKKNIIKYNKYIKKTYFKYQLYNKIYKYITNINGKYIDIFKLLKYVNNKNNYYFFKYTNKELINYIIQYSKYNKYKILKLNKLCLFCYNNKNINNSNYCMSCINFFSKIEKPDKIFSKYIKSEYIWYKELYKDKILINKIIKNKEKIINKIIIFFQKDSIFKGYLNIIGLIKNYIFI